MRCNVKAASASTALQMVCAVVADQIHALVSGKHVTILALAHLLSICKLLHRLQVLSERSSFDVLE